MSSGTNKARILAASEGRVEFTQSCLRAILIAEIYLKEREREILKVPSNFIIDYSESD